VDASGEGFSNFMMGQNTWLGNRFTCRAVSEPVTGDMTATNVRLLREVSPMEFHYLVAYLDSHSPWQLQVSIKRSPLLHIGLCLPGSCGVPEVEQLIRRFLEGGRSFGCWDMDAQLVYAKKPELKAHFFDSGAVLLLLIVVGGTLLVTLLALSGLAQQSRILACFDLASNWQLAWKPANPSQENRPINGLRVFSAFSLIGVHVIWYKYFSVDPSVEMLDARTYAKVLNRSKSFNVHGMNGSNDPSPIYIEKLTRNNYQPRQEPTFGYGLGQGPNANYKSNPHLFSGKDNSLKGGLKSPSIVNLISRSQKDLTKIAGCDEDDGGGYPEQDKKQLYLRGLHQQAPDLYRVIHGDEEYGGSRKYPLQAKYSLDSRSPPSVELNKDTASIVRRGSEVEHLHHQQQQHHHHHHIQSHQQQNLRRGSGATIIELRTAAGGHRK